MCSSLLAGYLAVFFICLFIINFAYSWGPMCWVYPAEVRSFDSRIITVANHQFGVDMNLIWPL